MERQRVRHAFAGDLATRARDGKLEPDEYHGSTFSISNLGMFGIDDFDAIINPPEAAILAVGTARQEPVLRDAELGSRTIMTLTLTVDHRVLNGAVAAAFLQEVQAVLEEPLRIVV
nr:2-oxo acid dehydrogenase subunit E2 [Brachybacterium fresconis]